MTPMPQDGVVPDAEPRDVPADATAGAPARRPTARDVPDPLPGDGPQARTYRPGTSWLYAVAFAVLALWWVGALVADGDGDTLAVVAPYLVAAALVVDALLWQPCVRADPHGVLLRNVVREVAVSWAAVTAVHTRFALTVEVEGRRFGAWAAPATGGRRASRRAPRPPGTPAEVTTTASSGALDADSGAAAFLLASVRPDRPRGEAVVVVRPNLRGIVPLSLAVVAVAVGVAVQAGAA